jgi:hypothetical protein
VKTLVAVLAALMIAACGSTSGAGGAPSPTPPTSPAAGFAVLITDHDRAVSVGVGQRIEVYLSQRSGMTEWQNLVADDTTVVQPVDTGIVPPPRGATIAGFVALRAGTANITATAGPLCSPGQACPMYAVLFSVRVTVGP